MKHFDKITYAIQVDPDIINWHFDDEKGRTSGQFLRGQPEFEECQSLQVFVPLNMDEYNAKLADEAQNDIINGFRDERQAKVNALKVTISTGKTFDADEVSINRMTGRVTSHLGVDDNYMIKWSTSDVPTGVMVDITLGELREALKAATDKVTELWAR